MNNNKPRANILIVEDEDVLRKVLEDTLTKLGYLVCNNFVSAGEAIEYTKTHKPDIVLMDIQLRGEMDGIEAAERIYSEQKIPVVFLTSYVDDVLLERAKLVGSFGYMLKPFKERELVATIDMALHKAKLERKLAESEEKHRLFFENSPIGIIHYNNNGIITEVNDSMISIFGSTREKLVGLDIDNIPDKKFSKEVYKSLEGEIGFYEDEYTSFTGKKSAIIKASWIPIIRDGEVISGVGIVENITERKQAEKELEQTNKVLKQERNMFISGPVVVFKWQNKEGWPVEYVSPNVKNVFGYSSEELLSGKMPYAEIIHKKDIDRVSNEVAAYSESDVENFKHKPYRIIRKDRKTICIADYTTILRDEAGKITHYMGYIEDITERLAAEQAIKKSEEKFKTIADFTYSWEYWIDPDQNFIYISPSCERISGYKPEEFIKDPELMVKIIYPDDKGKVINHKKNESDSKKVDNVDFRIITRNGDIRYIEHVCRPVYDKDGNYFGRRATNRDITENRRQETIRQMMYQISNAVNTSKDLDDFFKVIQLELGKVLKTKNFFIALYNKETDTLSLPYFIDEKDNFKTFPARKTLTAYVIKNKNAVILTEKEIKKLINSGEIEVVGTICKIWIGVPLISKEEVTGVLVVQSYENEKDFDKKDLELLKFISGQIGFSIERKKSEDFIRIQRDFALELNNVTSLSETLHVCLDATMRISGMDCGGIYLVDKDTGNLDLAFHKGLPEKFIKSASHFDADSDNARLIMKGKPVYSQPQKLDVNINNNRIQENLRAIAVIPVYHEGKVIACLNIASHLYDKVPANTRIAIQTIAAQIGNVIARVNTAKELKDSEEKYRQVVDNSLVGNYISQNYILKFCNQQLAEIFGYNNVDEMLEKDMREMIISESREFEYSEVKLRKPGEKDFSRYEFKGLKKDGSLIDIEVLGGSILYQGIPAMQGTLIDITERKKAEEELRKHREHLEELVEERTDEVERSQKSLVLLLEDVNEINQDLRNANITLDATNKELEAFSYSVSHDLRAPLTRMEGFSKALLTNYSGKLDDKGVHYLNRITASSQHMAKLIDNLLSLSRITRGIVTRQKVDLSQTIAKIAEELKASEPDREVEFKIAKGLYAKADCKIVEILLENLLGNSFKFTGKKENAVIEFGEKIIDDKGFFFIKDNGIGFNMKYCDKIFNVFQRLHSEEEYEGTGIGLAIAQRIINRHGGKIWAESEEGKGTTFYFRFE